MAKGNLAAGMIAMLAATGTLAQPARSDSGCSTIATLVQESVFRAATEYRPALPQTSSEHSGQARTLTYRQACLRTVEVTTDAFTRALADLGLSIGWYPPHPGDYCWSGDLSQCYPGPVPGEPALPPGQLAFVHDAWKGVQNAVVSHMRRGTASGVSTFTAESLEAALWSNLQLTVEGPLHMTYTR